MSNASIVSQPAIQITPEIARRVLEIVDCGLVKGVGVAEPGKMCVEAAVCYALNLPHGDDPKCVSPALRHLKIRLNDSAWSSDQARARGLRRLAVAQLGSAGVLDDRQFTKRVAELAIRTCVPAALRAAASVHKDAKHKAALLDAATQCEKNPNAKTAREARQISSAYAAAADAAAAYAAAYAAAAAYADAADAAYAAYAAAYAAAAADAAAAAYADAADAAAAAYAAAEREKKRGQIRDAALSEFAEGVVQILIEMKAPGCQFLELTEIAA